MGWRLYLPIAGNVVNIPLLMGLGCIVGFLSGLFGVGGGFLMTPLLIMIGIPPTVAAASDSNQLVAATTSATFAHARAGRVDFKMGLLLLAGGLIGGSLGVELIRVLRARGEADFVIRLTYIVMLAGVGSYMFYDSARGLWGTGIRESQDSAPMGPSFYARMVNALPFKMYFEKSKVTRSPLLPFLLGGLVGMLAAVMGLGGGFLMVPVMIYLLRMPMHVAVGTNLFQEIFTCANVTWMQAWMNHTVDVLLALMLLMGSVVGAQFGARVSRKLKADQLKILLSLIILAVMTKMLIGMLTVPELMLSYKGEH